MCLQLGISVYPIIQVLTETITSHGVGVWGSMITATMLGYSFTTLISFKQQLSVGHKGDEPILYHGLVV